MSRQRTHSRPRRTGLSLIEIMISLAISSMLLTAVGAAYSASSSSIEANEQFFRASQGARVSLNQILAELRKCQTATIDETAETVMVSRVPEDPSNPADFETRVYAYDADAQVLRMTTDKTTPASTFTLARQVESFNLETDGTTMSITMIVRVGENTVTLSGASTWRRAMP